MVYETALVCISKEIKHKFSQPILESLNQKHMWEKAVIRLLCSDLHKTLNKVTKKPICHGKNKRFIRPVLGFSHTLLVNSDEESLFTIICKNNKKLSTTIMSNLNVLSHA